MAEERALYDLVKKASAGAEPGADRFAPDQLSRRDRARLEKLTEKAAGEERGRFQRDREDAELAARIT